MFNSIMISNLLKQYTAKPIPHPSLQFQKPKLCTLSKRKEASPTFSSLELFDGKKMIIYSTSLINLLSN